MQHKSKTQKQRGWYNLFKNTGGIIVHCFIKNFRCPDGFLKYFDVVNGYGLWAEIDGDFISKYKPHDFKIYVNHEYNTINVEIQFNTIESRSKQLYELDKWWSYKLAEYRKYVSEQKIKKYFASI